MLRTFAHSNCDPASKRLSLLTLPLCYLHVSFCCMCVHLTDEPKQPPIEVVYVSGGKGKSPLMQRGQVEPAGMYTNLMINTAKPPFGYHRLGSPVPPPQSLIKSVIVPPKEAFAGVCTFICVSFCFVMISLKIFHKGKTSILDTFVRETALSQSVTEMSYSEMTVYFLLFSN